MSRCELRGCIFSLLSGFHKECTPFQRLIHAAQHFSIVALHAKFQLVLVPVVSLLSISKGRAYFYLDHPGHFRIGDGQCSLECCFSFILTLTFLFIGHMLLPQSSLQVRKCIQACNSYKWCFYKFPHSVVGRTENRLF